MKSTASIPKKHAFVLEISAVKKFWTMAEKLGNPKMFANCTDGVDRQFESIEEFETFENSPAKQILALNIQGGGEKGTFQITFGGKTYETIHIDATGNDEVVSSNMNRTTEIINGVTPWYNKLATFNYSYFFIFVFIGYYWYRWDTLTTFPSPDSAEYIEDDGTRLAAYFLSYIAIPFIVAALLELLLKNPLSKIRGIAFPLEVFAIGQGLKRNEMVSKIRGFLTGAAVIAIIPFVYEKLLPILKEFVGW